MRTLISLSNISFDDDKHAVLDEDGSVLTRQEFLNKVHNLSNENFDHTTPQHFLLGAFQTLTSADVCGRIDLFDDDHIVMPAARRLFDCLDKKTLGFLDASQLMNNFAGIKERGERYSMMFDIIEQSETIWEERHLWYFSELLHEYLASEEQAGTPDFPIMERFFNALSVKFKEPNLNYLLKNNIKRERSELVAIMVKDGHPDILTFCEQVSGYEVLRKVSEMVYKGDIDQVNAHLSKDMLSLWFPEPDKRFEKLAQKMGSTFPGLSAHLSKMQLEKDMGGVAQNKAKTFKKI